MNNTPFEKWIKSELEQQSFTPPTDGWQKLQSDLNRSVEAPNTKQLNWRKWAMAASVALVCGLGIAFFFSNTREVSQSDIQVSTAQSNPESSSLSGKKPPMVSNNVAATINRSRKASNGIGLSKKNEERVLVKQKQLQEPLNGNYKEEATIIPKEIVNNKTEKVAISPNGNNSIGKFYYEDAPFETDRTQPSSTVELGFAANTGNNTVGTMQHQIAFNVRKYVNSYLFLDAAVMASSTAVAFSNQQSFGGVQVNPGDHMGSSNEGYNISNVETPVTTKYKRSIYAVGVSPKLGVKLGKHFNIMAGGFLNRNINTEVDLVDNEAANNFKSSVDPFQTVMDWSAGVTGGIEYKLLKRLTTYAGYRQGLTNYAYFNNKYHKNSGVEFGLKLNFNK